MNRTVLHPLATVVLTLAAMPLEAAIEAPGCDALAAWAGSIDREAVHPVSPALTLPEAFAPETVEPLFGQPPLAWSGDDVLAARKALNACRQDARRAGERERAQALADANGVVARRLAAVVRSVARARETVATQLDAIGALPDSPDLAQAARIMVESDPARPRQARTALRGVERGVSRPFARLARALPDLPFEEQEALFTTLRERAGGIAGETQTHGTTAGGGEPAIIAGAGASSGPAAAATAPGEAPQAALSGESECDTIAAWAQALDPAVTFEPTPEHVLPAMFAPEHLESVFDKPALEWTGEDVRAARQSVNACRGEARRAGEQARASALADANTVIARDLRNLVRDVSRARTTAAEQQQAIDALPHSTQLSRAVRALVAMNPAAPQETLRTIHALERSIAQPFSQLARAMPSLPHAEREALLEALAEGEQDAVDEALARVRAEIEHVPESASGVLDLERVRLRLESMQAAGTAQATPVLEQAEAALAAARTALRHADPPVWIPPTCEALYAWGGAADALDFVQIGTVAWRKAFADDRVEPAFGRPVADWSEDDVGRFTELARVCRARVDALVASDYEIRRPPADAPELVGLASRGRWVDNGAREVRHAQEAMVARRAALEELAARREHIEALPAEAASLQELTRLARTPAIGALTVAERNAFDRFVRTQGSRIAAGVEAAIVAELEAVRVDSPADLGPLWHVGRQAMQRVPVEARSAVQRRFRQRLAAEARAVLPAFEAALDAVPATAAGLDALAGAIADVTGVPPEGHARLPGYTEAVAARAQALAHTLAQARCDALQARIELDDDDAALAVWDGEEGTTVGALVRALAERGHEVSGFEAPGLLSDTATLSVTLDGQPFQRIRLHEGEVAPGKHMLLGFEEQDANETRALSVADWERFVASTTGNGGDVDCARIMGTPVEQLSIDERMAAMGCVFGAAVTQMQKQRQ